MDQFYALVTGQDDAFCQMCMILPTVIQNVVNSSNNTNIPNDTVFDELKEKARQQKLDDHDLSMSLMHTSLFTFSAYLSLVAKSSILTSNASSLLLRTS